MIANHTQARSLSRRLDRNHGFRTSRTGLLLCGTFYLFALLQAFALSVQQFALQDLCDRADRIVRAKVLDVSPGSLAAGGGQIPITTYRLEVREALAGSELAVIDLKIVGSPKAQTGNIRRSDLLGDIPRLERGSEYLLFTTKPSKIGLVSFVGLGQGCFTIFPQDKKEVALNGAGNIGLGLERSGPVAYSELARKIRELRNR